MNAIVVLCTAPDQATAQRLAALALEARLAACVTLLAGCHLVLRLAGPARTEQRSTDAAEMR